ncbi:protein kinase, putative,polo-like protein kinase, putative [Trypanosoma cruzi marinkellei]|uniref:Serine/threonine-protein kinase PLK n=1 Tax=Trypanosoma cruzi marinkellei TaxID=85056 RepID=K2M0N6_TRYCR|nr:protein kinase, putative,polo-like protein kinase, putative [Trypanosoma cruzi marinkellei]
MHQPQAQQPLMPARRFPSAQQPLSEKPDFHEGSTLKEFDKQGRVVGRFRCGRLLGRGGFAKCYEVERDGESYALKVVDRSILQKTKTLQKLHSEISIHRRMKHKNIVNFIRTFQDDWNVYMLLEKCSNQTLMEISKRRPRFSVPETQHIMLQALAAIHYMHDQCVIHRDLKLGNMMMDAEMNVKIGDFGLAAELQYDGERKRTICGTPNYIAPEIIDSAHEGHSYEVDIWSLGVILYTLLVGEPPFQTSDVKATYRRIKQCRYEFPPRLDIPESGKELIHRILQSRPDHRPTLVEIRTHSFFRFPTPPSSAPLSLFPSSRRRMEVEGQQQPQKTWKGSETAPAAKTQREILRPLNTNTVAPGRQPAQPGGASQALFFGGTVPSACNQGKVEEAGDPPCVDSARPSPRGLPKGERHVTAPRSKYHLLDDEERNHLTVVHDHLQRTLLGEVDPYGGEKPLMSLPPHNTGKVPKPPTMTATTKAGGGGIEKVEEDRGVKNEFPLPSVWVTDYADFSAKYGLCYRLSTSHTGVHFNDSTKMVWEPITGRVEYYARVKEVVPHNNGGVVHARDQRQAFHMETFPESLNKKVTLIKYFKSYLSRTRNGCEGVEVVRCSPYMDPTPVLLSEPHMIEDIVYVKRWLLTPHAMIFRLSNKTIQVCFHDKAEVILSSESRVVTYTDASGHRITVPLYSATSHSNEIASRLRYTKDILCELIQNREL